MTEAHYSKEGLGVVEGGMWLRLWPRDLGGVGDMDFRSEDVERKWL